MQGHPHSFSVLNPHSNATMLKTFSLNNFYKPGNILLRRKDLMVFSS
jgi:hypothetical protein